MGGNRSTVERDVLFRGKLAAVFAVDRRGIFVLSEGPGLEKLGLEAGGMVGRSAFEAYGVESLAAENLRRALSGEASDRW